MATDVLADILARAGKSLARNLELSRAKQGINDLGPTGRGQVQKRPPAPEPMRKGKADTRLVSAGIDDNGNVSVMVEAPMRRGPARHKTTHFELYTALFVAVRLLQDSMKRADRREVKPEMDALEAVVAEKDMRRHHTLLNDRMREFQTEGLE